MENFNYADLAAIIIILYFVYFGWAQGIMRFILGFLALSISGWAAYSKFQETQNILMSLKILFFLSIILSVVAWIGLSIWNKTVSKTQDCAPLSRFLGALAGFCWAASLTAGIMLCFILVRADSPLLKTAKKLCTESYFFTSADKYVLSRYPLYRNFKNLYAKSEPDQGSTPKINLDLQSIPQEDIVNIREDSKFQELLNDEEIKEIVKEKDYIKLLTHPKIQSLLEDKEFTQKIMKLYADMATGQ